MTFAENTSVPVDRSKAELDGLLSKAGASQRMMGADDDIGEAWVIFSLAKRQVRMKVPLPKRAAFPSGRWADVGKPGPEWKGDRKPEQAHKLWEQACRVRWRAMVLLTKAKLEAIAMGQTTVEREFLADLYLADGRTVHQAIAADLEASYLTGKMPPLLGTGGPNGS